MKYIRASLPAVFVLVAGLQGQSLDPKTTLAYLSCGKFECWVNYVSPPRPIAKLLIRQPGSPERIVAEFDPLENGFIRMYSVDLTGDGRDELVSLWGHGAVAVQVTVHSLWPQPELIFHAVVRGGAYADFDIRTHERFLRLISSTTSTSEQFAEEYSWSRKNLRFERRSPRGAEVCRGCFNIIVPKE